jgi:uncharacterized protein (TIGR03083 family)
MNWIDAVEHEGHALSVAARHDTTAAIPACPGWTMDDLLRHIGTVHHRTSLLLREQRNERPANDEVTPPHGDSLGWYEAGLAAVLEALRTTDPDTALWTFGGEGTASFWQRRMAQETVVHRVDAEQATGVVAPIAPDLAVDGIAELVEVFLVMRAGRDTGAPATVHLHTTDVEGEWLLRIGEGTMTVERGHAKGDAAVRGPASDLYLWLWGRVPLDRLEVFGDAGLTTRVRELASI